jgi:hypothetical protein
MYEVEQAREKAKLLGLPDNRDCGNCASYQDHGAPNNCDGCETDIQQNWTPAQAFRATFPPGPANTTPANMADLLSRMDPAKLREAVGQTSEKETENGK